MSDLSDVTEAARCAGAALSLCRRGETAEGLAAYTDIFKNGGAGILPVALHARMLTEAGLPEVAEQLVALGLSNGADVSTHGAVGKIFERYDNSRVLEEYRQLFARGRFNTLMVERYLARLVAEGEIDEVGRILNPAFVRTYDLTDGSGGAPVADPAAIRDILTARSGKAAFLEKSQSIRNSAVINDVDSIEDPAITALIRAVLDRIDRYRSSLEADAHVVMTNVPARYRLETWCVISEGDGYNVPHKHGRGWITGVFYAAAPPEALVPGDDQGAICIGRQKFIPADAAGWRTVTIAPVSGRLVLMPSYAVHWTKPLKQPGLRIAVAIDVCIDR